MKKYIPFQILFTGMIFSFHSCSKTEFDSFGHIHGIVTDSKTGDPVRAASVTLSPDGITITTGNDGRYEYNDLDPGQYVIQVKKDSYQSSSKNITVKAGSTARGDIQINYGSGTLQVNKSAIEFGSSNNLAVFDIHNTGSNVLEWSIEYSCDWINQVSPASGSTAADSKTSVSIQINRSKITENKKYTTTLVLKSNGGSTEIVLTVNGTGSTTGGNIVPAGMITSYTFDDQTVNDQTEYELHGSLVNNPVFITDTPNGSGKALSLIGGTKNQFVNIPYNPFLKQKTYSIAFWIKDFGEGMIFSAISTDGMRSNYPRLMVKSGKFKLTTGYDNWDETSPFDYGISVIQDQKWHHIIITASRPEEYSITWNKNLYIDGKLVDSASSNNPWSSQGDCTKIQIGGTGGMTGITAMSLKIDNIRFYNRILDRNEVKIIYEGEK